MKWWFKQKLYIQIFVMITLGIIAGLIFGENISVIEPIGDIFLRSLMVLVVPLTIFTIIAGITKLNDSMSVGRIGLRISLFYFLTSMFAVGIGVLVAFLMRPGQNAEGMLAIETEDVEPETLNLINQLVSWVPENAVEAMANQNMLQIIILSIALGLGLLALGEKGKTLKKIFNEGSDLMLKITEYVMYLAPYGIFALIATTVGTLGTDMLMATLQFIYTQYLGLAILLIVVYPLLLKFLAKQNIITFYKKASPALLIAASTSSSAATIPASMKVCKENFGIPEKVYGFTIPLGSTVNMDGGAVAWGVLAVFASYLYGMEITFASVLTFVFLGTALSIGTAGVRGAPIITSTILLSTLGLPLELVPILAAIWPLIDIGNTTTNITGDLVGTTYVASSENEIGKFSE